MLMSTYYVLNDKATLPTDMQGRTYSDWKFVLNLWETFLVLRKQKPDVVCAQAQGLGLWTQFLSWLA